MEAIEGIVHSDEDGNTALKPGTHFSKKWVRIVAIIKDDQITISFKIPNNISIK